MQYLIIFTCLIFVVLALFHSYWLLGGKKFIQATIPTKENTERLFEPSFMATLVVAIGLLVFATIIFAATGLIQIPFSKQGTYLISIIFLTRTIGDFNYIGLFKKVKNSRFAKNDNRIYVPLCLYLSIASFVIAAS